MVRIGAAHGRWHQYTQVGVVGERARASPLQAQAVRSYGLSPTFSPGSRWPGSRWFDSIRFVTFLRRRNNLYVEVGVADRKTTG